MCPKCPEVIVPGNPGSCTHILGKSYEKIIQEKDYGNDHHVARVAREHIWFLDTMDTISGYSGKSYEKNVQEKDYSRPFAGTFPSPGNTPNT
jgi:hypothetical protein